MVKLPNYAMVNLIAGRTIVPELIQHDFTAARVLDELKRIIPDTREREQMQKDLAEVREKLKPGAAPAAERAARAVLQPMSANPK
jgi:lipid-A-disaccharide synthase